MKNICHFIALTALMLSLTACHRESSYMLVWSDEFEGDCLNTDYWNVEDNARGGGNAELQYFSPDNVTVEHHPLSGEGCLVLTARRQDYTYGENGYRPCTSGRVNTQDKATFQYGRIEARICFPHTGNGLWPAFWMLGNNLITDMGNDDSSDHNASADRVVWPKCGEIDICEMGHVDGIRAGVTDRFFNGAAHWGESWNNGQYPNTAGVLTAPYPLQDEFHTWTLDWTPDSIAMYLDTIARPYFTLSLRDKAVQQPGCYFNHPFYLVFNLSVGGFFPGMPNPEKYSERISADLLEPVTALPADGTPVRMYVDYIRYYQKK